MADGFWARAIMYSKMSRTCCSMTAGEVPPGKPQWQDYGLPLSGPGAGVILDCAQAGEAQSSAEASAAIAAMGMIDDLIRMPRLIVS